ASVAMSNAPAMPRVWEPAQQALRKVLRGAAEPRAAMVEAERKVLESLRPPPPPARRGPYALALALGTLAAAAWMVRGARARDARATAGAARSSAYAYLLPAAVAMVVLVFVPFTVGAGMSLFWHDAGRWTFVGLHNFADILLPREAPITDPLSFYF